jgi:hypothetical protein
MLLYRGNRFVRRLEGPLDVVAPGEDPEATLAAAAVLLGKRTHTQMMQNHKSGENLWQANTSHGIVSVYKHKSGKTIPSKTVSNYIFTNDYFF